MLNAGNRLGTSVPRWLGNARHDFNVFCPKAMAGIGDLPATVADRAINIRLKRRAPSERVADFRHRVVEEEAFPHYLHLWTWSKFHTDDLRDARPDIPPELDDRAADAWEPLLAMADLTGRDWPQRARNAALQLSGIRAERNVSDGIRVLADIRDVLDELGASRISSKELTQRLCAIPEAPWADYKGTGLDQRALAKLLGQYEIKTKDRRVRTVAQDLRACAVRRRRAAIPSPQQH